jgi:hypothetical protein
MDSRNELLAAICRVCISLESKDELEVERISLNVDSSAIKEGDKDFFLSVVDKLIGSDYSAPRKELEEMIQEIFQVEHRIASKCFEVMIYFNSIETYNDDNYVTTGRIPF